MISLELLILLALVIPMLVISINYASGTAVLRFPFLFSMSWLALIIPQMFVLTLSDNVLANYYRNAGVIFTMNLTAALCYVAGIIGYIIYRPKNFPIGIWNFSFKERRRIFFVTSCVSAVSLISVFFFITSSGGFVSLFSEAEFYSLELRGSTVYYIYLARFIFVPILVLIILLSQKKSTVLLLLLLLLCSYPLANILFLFRRSDVAMLGMIAGFSAIVYYSFSVSRPLAIGSIFGMLFVVAVFPLLRKIAIIGDGSGALDLREEGWLNQLLVLIEVQEKSAAVVAAGTFDQTMDSQYFGFGSIFWNSIINQFVPRGLVGEEFKNALLISSDHAASLSGIGYSLQDYFYIAPFGFTNAFEQFWYFGFILFFLLGFLAARAEKWRIKSFRGEIFYVAFLPILVLSVTNDMDTLPAKLLGLFFVVMLFPKIKGSRRFLNTTKK